MTDTEGQEALTQLTDADVPALVAEVRRLRTQVEAVAAVHEKGEHNGLAICLHCAQLLFPPPETGIWSESAWPCESLRALGVTEDEPAVEETHVVADDSDGLPRHEIWSPHCEDGCCR